MLNLEPWELQQREAYMHTTSQPENNEVGKVFYSTIWQRWFQITYIGPAKPENSKDDEPCWDVRGVEVPRPVGWGAMLTEVYSEASDGTT